MTQAELAERLNYTDKAVSKWERGESVPDVAVLKTLASLFGVTVDYLLEENHEVAPTDVLKSRRTTKNRGFITGMSIILLWLLTTLAYIMFEYLGPDTFAHWLVFVYAVPASALLWLVFNSIWFERRRNFLIISLLMWSALAAVLVSFLAWDINGMLIPTLGIPGQLIIWLWSRITKQKKADVEGAKSE